MLWSAIVSDWSAIGRRLVSLWRPCRNDRMRRGGGNQIIFRLFEGGPACVLVGAGSGAVPHRTKERVTMDMLWAIIVGIFAGIIAKLLVPGDREISGFIMTAVLGVIGAVAASWASRKFGLLDSEQASIPVVAIGGAIIVLGLWAATARRR